jgi:hypothetical protein
MTTETPYTETEALLAAMNNDAERLRAIVDDMTTSELRGLVEAAYTVYITAYETRRTRLAS